MSNIEFFNLRSKVSALRTDVDTIQASLGSTDTSLSDHIQSSSNTHLASAVSLDTITNLSANNVQDGILELLTKISDHISSTTAHEALDIGVEPLSIVIGANLQELLENFETKLIDDTTNLQTQIDTLSASQVGINSPVGRTFANTQHAIDVLDADIKTLLNDSGDHQNSIDQILTSLLNQGVNSQLAQDLKLGLVSFDALVIPTSPPASPRAGSVFFNIGTSELNIHNGTTYKTITLL